MSTMSAIDRLPPSIRVAKRAIVSWYSGEAELRLLPYLCRRDEITLDIGANYGIYAWHATRWSKSVVLFEPQPDIACFLRSAFGGRVRVEEVALSHAAGEAVMRVPVDRMLNGCATVEAENTLQSVGTREVRVPLRTLDNYGFAPVGFVKIDVEGHELAVLRGASRLLEIDRPAIMLEAEERHRSRALDSVVEFLAPFGYRGYYTRGGRLHPVATLATAGRSAGTVASAEGIFNFIFLARQDVDPKLAALLAEG